MTARFASMDDLELVDRICNEPSVRLWIALEGMPSRCVAEHYLTEPSFAVLVDNGCFLLQALGHRRFAVHANLLPSARKLSERHAREGIELLRDHGAFGELVAAVPRCLPHSALLARRMGFELAEVMHRLWPMGGMLYDVDVLTLKLDNPPHQNRSEGDDLHPGDCHA